MVKTVTITSGKGGVGKTNISTNLSLYLSSLGYRTCLFDADLGLANINIVLGLYPENTIEDVIQGEMPLSSVIIKDFHGIDIIPGSSGVEGLANIEPHKIDNLIKSFLILDQYDFLFFDTSAGISKNVISFCLASSEILLVITPEPTSLTDAYALLKILTLNGLQCPVKIVINQCMNAKIAKQTYAKFSEVVKRNLSVDLQPLGMIITDQNVSGAVKDQQPFISLFPDTVASRCIMKMGDNFLKNSNNEHEGYSIESFWKQCIHLFKSNLNLDGKNKSITTPSPAGTDTVTKHSPPLRSKENPPRIEKATYGFIQLDETFYSHITKLIESIDTVSHEVRELKEVIKKKNNEP